MYHGTLSTQIPFYHERERERETMPLSKYNSDVKNEEQTVSTLCQRGRPIMFFMGFGSGGVRHVVQTAQKMPKKPADSSSSRGHVTCLGLTAVIVRQLISLHCLAFLPLLCPGLFFHLPQVEMLPCISLFKLCVKQMSSDLYDDAVQVNMSCICLRIVDVLQQWKHLCVTFKKISSSKISQNVCTRLFWKLFIQII